MVRIKSIEEIQNFTCFIRSLRKGLITNFYLNVEKHSIWIETGEFFVHETPECIFFLHENGNFYHLFFTATSTDSLCAALQKASFCNELLIFLVQKKMLLRMRWLILVSMSIRVYIVCIILGIHFNMRWRRLQIWQPLRT